MPVRPPNYRLSRYAAWGQALQRLPFAQPLQPSMRRNVRRHNTTNTITPSSGDRDQSTPPLRDISLRDRERAFRHRSPVDRRHLQRDLAVAAPDLERKPRLVAEARVPALRWRPGAAHRSPARHWEHE